MSSAVTYKGDKKVSGHNYNRIEAINKRLSLFNDFALPFLKYNREFVTGDAFSSSYAKRVLPYNTKLLSYEPPDNPKIPVGHILLRFSNLNPKVNDLWLVVYTSAQRTRKRPSQVDKIINTTKKYITRKMYDENKNREVIFALLAPKGATRGAYKELRSRKFLVATSPKDLKNLVVRWLKEHRWDRLWTSLKGKRVYGPLALVMLLIADVIRSLEGSIVSSMFLLNLLEAAVDPTHGVVLPEKPPPPLEDVYQRLEMEYESGVSTQSIEIEDPRFERV